MFNTVQPSSNLKQLPSFAASLSLQAALLALLLMHHALPGMPSCPSLHQALSHANITPIYFQPTAITDSATQSHGAPAPAVLKPAPLQTAKAQPVAPVAPPPSVPTPAPAAAAPAPAPAEEATAAAPAQEETSTVAPFASWSPNATAGGSAMYHHQVKQAMPVFTPDPPILHKDFPDVARGKDVVIEVVINEQGSVVAAQVVQGIGGGVEDAMWETLQRWIFVPAKVNGMAIASRQQVHFHFPG
jgi:TonB family protein